MRQMTEKEFETYWAQHRKQLLEANAEYREAIENYKMNTGADWLLFAFPVVVAVVLLDWAPFDSEVLNWVIGAVAAVVVFVLSVWVKSMITGTRPISQIEEEVKEQERRNSCHSS